MLEGACHHAVELEFMGSNQETARIATTQAAEVLQESKLPAMIFRARVTIRVSHDQGRPESIPLIW